MDSLDSSKQVSSARNLSIILLIVSITALQVTYKGYDLGKLLDISRGQISQWLYLGLVNEFPEYRLAYGVNDKSTILGIFPQERNVEKLGRVDFTLSETGKKYVKITVDPNKEASNNKTEIGFSPDVISNIEWSRDIAISTLEDHTVTGTITRMITILMKDGVSIDVGNESEKNQDNIDLVLIQMKRVEQLKLIAEKLSLDIEENDSPGAIYRKIENHFYDQKVTIPNTGIQFEAEQSLWVMIIFSIILASIIETRMTYVSLSPDKGAWEPWIVIDGFFGVSKVVSFVWFFLILCAPICTSIMMFLFTYNKYSLNGSGYISIGFLFPVIGSLLFTLISIAISMGIYRKIKLVKMSKQVELMPNKKINKD